MKGVPQEEAPSQEIKLQPGFHVVENVNQFQEVYRIGETLGKGSYTEVRLCSRREDRGRRAVKIFRKDLMRSEIDRARLEREIEIVKTLDHPNIIRIHEFFEDVKKIYIVMEYCHGGQLFDEIVKRQNFSEQDAVLLMQQLLSCVSYLHSNQIVHRDLKPENILLEEKNNLFSIKLINFGTASIKHSQRIKGQIGTAYYVAPEVLSSCYTEKCDLWSCGVILYLLLAGYPPFEGDTDEEVIARVKAGKIDLVSNPWPLISQEAKTLITHLLCPQNQRFSAEQALQSSWIRGGAEVPSDEVTNPVLNRLKQFNSSNKLREAVETFIVSQCVSAKDTRSLREVFQRIDKNGDGKLSKDELFEEYSKFHSEAHALEEVERIMKEVDTDHNGFINYSEFIKATMDQQKVFSSANLKRAFQLFDTENRGSISSAELKHILQGSTNIDESIWTQIIEDIDCNGDGRIDVEEFEQMLTTKL